MQHKRHGVRPSLSTGEDRHALIVHENVRASQHLGTARRQNTGAQIHIEAASAQELAYLGAWLSSRVDAKGKPLADSALTVYAYDRRQIARCVRLARARHVDWIQPAPAITFDRRIAALLGPSRHTRGALALAIEEGAAHGD